MLKTSITACRSAALLAIASMSVAIPVDDPRANAATVETAYVAGHLDVTINGYGTSGLGAFAFDTGTGQRLAWCIEAHHPHSSQPDRYRPVPPEHPSTDLDTLVWLLERSSALDDDTATAGAALAWWYTDARRTIGPPVWSDGTASFAPIDPFQPHDWSALPPITLVQPIGLRSGSVDLDAAERRVVELHQAVVAWRGPWEIGLAGTDRIAVRGPNGPIRGVEITLTLTTPGQTAETTSATTAADGTVPLPTRTTDAVVEVLASVEAPGPHQEWDGDGDVQRMVTATTIVHETSVVLNPPSRHIEIEKVSSDPTIAPEGATFDILDSNGELVESVGTDASGRVRAAPIDPLRHSPPFRIVETRAPVGLDLAAPVDLDDASSDPDHPTIVRIVDDPLLVRIVIRKRLSIPATGPIDRSGFGFVITRTSDQSVQHTTSGADGSTAPVGLTIGEHTICEIESPSWASGLVDGGCRDLTVTPADATAGRTITVDYLNLVPTPTIDSHVLDPVDGDREVTVGTVDLIDHVRFGGTVPGTTYRFDGAIVSTSGEPTGATSVVRFRAVDHVSAIEVPFDISTLGPGTYVAIGHLSVIDPSGGQDVQVAVHDDRSDTDQTFVVAGTLVESSTDAPRRPPSAPSTLPPTGADANVLRRALRLADAMFLLGVALGVVGAIRSTVRP